MNKKLKLEELDRINVEQYKKSQKVPLVIVLDNIRSLNNIGSVFRTADAFRVESIFLCGLTAQPPHRDIQKTALGATASVEWKYFENTLNAVEELKQNGYQICAVEQAEETVLLQDYQPTKKVAIVMGNEVEGVSQEVIDFSDVCMEIPQFGTKHSLNISVCTGVVVWEVVRKMGFPKK